MTKSKFVTIVAPEQVRSEFTHVREDLMTTDKQLMQALWNVAMRASDALRQEVADLKAVADHLKTVGKITRGDMSAPSHCCTEEAAVPAAAKAKVKKATVKKEAKPKPVKKVVMFEGKEEPETFVGEDDDDMGCLVIDGTK